MTFLSLFVSVCLSLSVCTSLSVCASLSVCVFVFVVLSTSLSLSASHCLGLASALVIEKFKWAIVQGDIVEGSLSRDILSGGYCPGDIVRVGRQLSRGCCPGLGGNCPGGYCPCLDSLERLYSTSHSSKFPINCKEASIKNRNTT